MRKSRFTEAQIVEILRAFDAGTPAEELAAATAFTPIPSGCGVQSMRG